MGTLLGLAIGDALGQPYEGVSSEEMKKIPEEELKIFSYWVSLRIRNS